LRHPFPVPDFNKQNEGRDRGLGEIDIQDPFHLIPNLLSLAFLFLFSRCES
jgi:hypothetical protein